MQAMAREAGALLMEHFRRHVKIEYKGSADLVTIADRQSEALILERIRDQFPAHDVMGEEGTRIETGSDYKWYVDPLDGTTNFAHGYPVFCVSLAVEFRGQRIAGVIYDPTRDEMFSAAKGSGAQLNDEAIHVSPTAKLAESSDWHGFPQPEAPQESEYLFLSSPHVALAWRAAGRVGGARLVQCRLRALRGLLGVQSQSVGHSSRCADR